MANTIYGSAPAFSAYQSSAQSISAGTYTKINFQTEEFDTNSNFDTGTSRFTPSIAGYYQINGNFYTTGSASSGYAVIAFIYKNGSQYKWSITRPSTNTSSASVSSVVYFNGSTDYVELYGYTDSGSAGTTLIYQNYFNGAFVRSAA